MTSKYQLPATIETDRYTVLLTIDPLVPSAGIDFVKHETPEAGAVVYFGGITRNSFQGKTVRHLAYDCYVPMALRTLERIAKEALTSELKNGNGSAKPGDGNGHGHTLSDSHKSQVCKIYLAHRLGTVPVGEESVLVVVSTPHRQEGWAAAERALEHIKVTAEIWKNEVYEDGTGIWKGADSHACGCVSGGKSHHDKIVT
jgi:molybdopterin synthase catalytic subunit